MTPMTTDLEDELRQLYAAVTAPPLPLRVVSVTSMPQLQRHARPRRRQTLLALAIATTAAVALVATLLATRQLTTTQLLSVRVLPAGADLSCTLPIVALSADQPRGLIVLRNGQASFQAANVPQGAYIAALHQWVDGTPRRLNDADTTYYSVNENRSTVTVTVHDEHGAHVVFTADSKTQDGPMGWFGKDIVLFEPDHHSQPAVAHVLLLDPSTGNARLVPGSINAEPSFGANGSSTGYIPGSGAIWTTFSRDDGTRSALQRYDLTTGVSTELYSTTGFIEMVGVDGGGHPIIQVGSRDIFHVNPAKRSGITTRTLMLTGAPQPTVLNEGSVGDSGVADNLSPLSLTDGDTVWMAADNGQIWRYTPDHGMQLVAKVTTSTEGAPGVAIEGPCR